MRIINVLVLLLGFLLSTANVFAKDVPPINYQKWLKDLKTEMSERGISQKTLNAVFAKNYYHPQHSVIKQDRNQNEFILTSADYLHRVLSKDRVQQGQKLYKKLQKKYPEGIYNVPLHYLVAFWGIETNYGEYKGGDNAVEALMVLSYDQRRPQFFREELYNLFKIIDNYGIDIDNIESSWAGAMGHFQFMPSTFNNYAVDADNDGQIDIWNNFSDAIASAGNYLTQIGWQKDKKWGTPVSVKWNFDFSQSGRNKPKSISEWQKLGVNVQGFSPDISASLIVPDGNRNQAYLVFDNFNIIMQWNKSENYALAVGLLADSIKNNKKPHLQNNPIYKLTTDDIKKIQQFINDNKIANLDIDGYLGTKTKIAVQHLQQKFHLPADGFPDYKLLKNIQNFSQKGYKVFPQPQRLHSIK